MPRSLRWTQLLPGLAALAALIAVVLGVLLFAQVGAASGDSIRIFAAVGSVRGIMRGSEVWLHGMPVGIVHDVGFRSASVPVDRRLLVSIDLGEQYRSFIRIDTDAQIAAGGSFIGSPVIHLNGGSSAARPIHPGDTVVAKEQADMEAMTSDFARATGELPAILKNVRMIGTQLRATTSTIGAFSGEVGAFELGGLQEHGSHIAARLRTGRGTIGLALGGPTTLTARARAAIAGADSLRLMLAAGRGELGRFRRDSSLMRAVGEVRDELSIVRALLDEPRGTAGRVLNDRAIRLELARADSAMQLLFADIKRRPLRYLHVF